MFAVDVCDSEQDEYPGCDVTSPTLHSTFPYSQGTTKYFLSLQHITNTVPVYSTLEKNIIT
jgi:hypothetical protein